MSARLILNADDFGLTPGINRAIADLHTIRALTSTTLMANGPAFADAVRIAHAHPTLGVGCHIVLVDGLPVAPPQTIPTLLAADGIHLRPSLSDFFLAVLRGKVDAADIAREAHAQISRLQQHGIQPTHIDTHKHTHILPQIAHPLLAVAERAGIRAIRNPFEPSWCPTPGATPFVRRLQVSVLRRLRTRFLALPHIRSGLITTTDGTLGVAATGTLDAAALNRILLCIPSGTWELVCHPGYNDPDLDTIPTRLRSTREVEREALIEAFVPSVRDLLHPPRIPLINYAALSSPEKHQ